MSCAIGQESARTTKEFREYVASKLSQIPGEKLDEIVAAVDKNSDGVVDENEFAGRMAAIQSAMRGDGDGGAPQNRRDRRPEAKSEPIVTSDYMDGAPVTIPQLSPGNAATVLLIAGDELAEAWRPYAEWKTQQGRATKIISVRQIARSFEAASIQEKIRLCVRRHVEQHGTKWVILGGDSEPGGGSVPGGHTTYHTQEPQGIPTDIVYLSPTNWDADGDGRHGEWEDDRDAITYPDGSVGLGHIPVRTAEDVAAFTDKVIAYDSQYPEGDFANQMLFTCTESMATAKVRASWDKHIDKLWGGQMQRYFPDSSEPTVTRVQSALSDGSASKMHIHGHGTIGAWQLSDEDFTGKHVADLSNRGVYPLITTVSCNTGEFDSQRDPSIVESMLRASSAGSVAIVAPIRTGKMHLHDMPNDFQLMIKEGKLDGTTMVMTGYWMHGLGKQRTTGEALMLAKADLIEDARKTARYHLCLCELNLLGDPTLDFRAKAPRRPMLEAPESVATGRQTIEVQTDAPQATVTLRQGTGLLEITGPGDDGITRFEVEITKTDPIDVTVSGPDLNTHTAKVAVRSE
ncbi:MAG: C25 family cysteine peptidase [Verrucomicrobiales bacterium]